MLISCPPYEIDVDVERTRAFYRSGNARPTSEGCTCPGCQNYDKAIPYAPAGVLTFLDSLGIDPRCPGEAYSIKGVLEDDGTVWYSGWYYAVGRIVRRPEQRLDDKGVPFEAPDDSYRPAEHAEICFRDREHDSHLFGRSLCPEGFPQPAIALEFYWYLPYLVDLLFNQYDEDENKKRLKKIDL